MTSLLSFSQQNQDSNPKPRDSYLAHLLTCCLRAYLVPSPSGLCSPVPTCPPSARLPFHGAQGGMVRLCSRTLEWTHRSAASTWLALLQAASALGVVVVDAICKSTIIYCGKSLGFCFRPFRVSSNSLVSNRFSELQLPHLERPG